MSNVSPEGCIGKHFIKFLPIETHSGVSHCQSVFYKIDINNCRGQCYDNAANTSGFYSGFQAHIKKINPLIEWVPCSAHTLNLVGQNSINCCLETKDLFNFMQMLFKFSSKSTSRLQTITAGLEPNDNHRIETLKGLSDSRWSAHAQVTKAL